MISGMYRKHIEHFITVTLRYFFDFDYMIVNNAFLMMLLAAGGLRLLFARVANEFEEGIVTVREDALTIREHIAMLRERWMNSELYERIMTGARIVKENVPARFRLFRK